MHMKDTSKTKNITSKNYDAYATTFAKSRQGMKWAEIAFLVEQCHQKFPSWPLRILDVWCGWGRLLETLIQVFRDHEVVYVWIDNSSAIIDESIKYAQELGIPKKWNTHFEVLDMVDMDQLGTSFDAVFFIASFHHLDSAEKRLLCLKSLSRLLVPDSWIYMTNWNLLWSFNDEKYAPAITKKYADWSADFSIKIGKHQRYYHGFTNDSLQNIITKAWYEIVSHEVGERNFVTIISL